MRWHRWLNVADVLLGNAHPYAFYRLVKMINFTEHPMVLLFVALFSVPIYLGLALVVFGNREGVSAVVKYLKTPETWNPLKSPWDEDLGTNGRILLFAFLCIAFVVAIYDLCVRYVIAA
jgi:hypothetical protein